MNASRTAKFLCLTTQLVIVVGIGGLPGFGRAAPLTLSGAMVDTNESDSTFQIKFTWDGTIPAAPTAISPNDIPFNFVHWDIDVQLLNIDQLTGPNNDLRVTAMHLLHPAAEGLDGTDGDPFMFDIMNIDLAASLPGPTLSPPLTSPVFKDLTAAAGAQVDHDPGHFDIYRLSYRRAAATGPVDFQFNANHAKMAIPLPAAVWLLASGLSLMLLTGQRRARRDV